MIPPEALEAIYRLLENGATVVLGERRPTRAPGLKNYPQSDWNVRKFTERLWGVGAGVMERRSIGKGTLISGTSPDKVLQEMDRMAQHFS